MAAPSDRYAAAVAAPDVDPHDPQPGHVVYHHGQELPGCQVERLPGAPAELRCSRQGVHVLHIDSEPVAVCGRCLDAYQGYLDDVSRRV